MASSNWAVNSSLLLSHEEISPAPTKVTSDTGVEVAVTVGIRVGEGVAMGGKQEATTSEERTISDRINKNLVSRKLKYLERLIIVISRCFGL